MSRDKIMRPGNYIDWYGLFSSGYTPSMRWSPAISSHQARYIGSPITISILVVSGLSLGGCKRMDAMKHGGNTWPMFHKIKMLMRKWIQHLGREYLECPQYDVPSLSTAHGCWKSRGSKNRYCIIAGSTQFYDDGQRRMNRDQEMTIAGRCVFMKTM